MDRLANAVERILHHFYVIIRNQYDLALVMCVLSMKWVGFDPTPLPLKALVLTLLSWGVDMIG